MPSEPVLFSAGAGTGKTTTLATYYIKEALKIWLSQQKMKAQHPLELPEAFVEQILAITFTENAAAEMKEKIEKKLLSLETPLTEESLFESEPLLVEPLKQELEAITKQAFPESASGTRQLLLDFAAHLKADLPEAHIQTIHSFCMRVIKENAALLQLDPEVEVQNDLERNKLLGEVCRLALLEHLELSQHKPCLFADLLQLKGLQSIASELKELFLRRRGEGESFPRKMEGKQWEALLGAQPSREERLGAEEVWQLLQIIEEKFEKRKRSLNVIDFDDQLFLALDVLKRSNRALNHYRRQYRKIFVDEFQDVNPLQFRIICLLCQNEQNELDWNKLFLVGDAKQSIYAFRGADVSVFMQTEKKLPQEAVQRLNTNFRSVPEILRFVNAFFGYWAKKAPADPEAEAVRFQYLQDEQDGDALSPSRAELPADEEHPPGVYCFGRDWKGNAEERRKKEAEAIASLILELTAEKSRFKRYDFPEIAVLFRSLSPIKFYEAALLKKGVPYVVVSGRGLFQRQEVLDILHAFKSILDPYDQVALLGFLRSPMIGLSDEALLALATEGFQQKKPLSLREALLHQDLEKALNDSGKAGELFLAQKAKDVLLSLSEKKEKLTISELVVELIERTAFLQALLSTENGKQKAANVKKLIELARSFEQKASVTHDDFVSHLEQMVEQDVQEAEAPTELEGVQLMTIHQAKGKEFPVVFVADLAASSRPIRGLFLCHKKLGIALKLPDFQNLELKKTNRIEKLRQILQAEEKEESKRLLYVAFTRARDYLFIGGARARKNQKDLFSQAFSDFLKNGVTEGVSVRTIEPVETEPVKAKPPLFETIHFVTHDPHQEEAARKHLEKLASKKLAGLKQAKLSISRFVDALLCKRKFYYTAIQGLDEYDELGVDPNADESADDATKEGMIAHNLLSRLPFEASKAEQKAFLERELKLQPLLSEEKRKIMEDHLKRFLNTSLADQMRRAKRIWTEHPFMLPLRTTSNFCLFLTGSIDALFLSDEGKVHIVEYKYARFQKKRQADYDLQLGLYTYAAQLAWKEAEVIPCFVFLKDEVQLKEGNSLSLAQEQVMKHAHELQKLLSFAEDYRKFKKLEHLEQCRSIDCKFIRLCWGKA